MTTAARSAEELLQLAEEANRALVALHTALQAVATPAEPVSLQVIPTGQNLTSRERECLVAAAEGLTMRAMASRLAISQSSVKTCLTQMRDKLGARSSAQAVSHAYQLGILAIGGDPQ